MQEMFSTQMQLQIDVGDERAPAVEAEERKLAGVGQQVMLQTDRDLEHGLAFRTDAVLRISVFVDL